MINIIAHRGARKRAPQNTIPAFQKAIELNADGFENDVHLTKDDVIVICHNYDIDETSTGTGLIRDYTYEQLLSFDFGVKFAPEFAGTKIPRLEEFLALCSKDTKVINIEIKPPQYPNSPIAAMTIDMVKRFGLFDNLLISSFDPQVLIDCKKIDPATKTGLLYEPGEEKCEEVCDDFVAYARKLNVDAVHPFIGFVSEDYIEEAHEAGLLVNPWTVNEDFQIEALVRWGCDGLITDVPDYAREIAEKAMA